MDVDECVLDLAGVVDRFLKRGLGAKYAGDSPDLNKCSHVFAVVWAAGAPQAQGKTKINIEYRPKANYVTDEVLV